MRFLTKLAGGVFALGGLALCVWLSLSSVPTAFVAMACCAALAVGAIFLIARRAGRETVWRTPSTVATPVAEHDPIAPAEAVIATTTPTSSTQEQQ
ncbi:hypothetical protein ACIBQ1_10060 [Nonomuraea sp. NPDC050153]|uniref:hypothetical protein n=1 Tax=Nonomuraea sp. NPDC050153 TaxID=3364359 RepID=UPI0037B07571